MNRRLMSGALIALCAAGCVEFDSTAAGETRTTTLWTRLGTRVTLAVDSRSELGVAARDSDGNDVPCVQPVVVGGRMIVRGTAEGVLLLEALDIELTDVVLDAGKLIDEPLRFTDLRLRLGTQLAIAPEWTETTRAVEASSTADLLLDWTLVTADGVTHPLATQLLRDAPFHLRVELDDAGEVRAELATTVDGPVWDWGRVALSDLSMAVYAAELRAW